MKKFCMLAASLMMLSASADTLTVFDEGGYDTNILVPISIDMLEVAQSRTQILYPAEKLTAMKDMDINSISFYTDGGCTLEGGLLTISMGETSMNDFVDDFAEDLTVVSTTTITSQYLGDYIWEISIQFTTPYHYNGGNLVFEVYTTTPGHGSRTEFFGTPTDYTSALIDIYRSSFMRESFMPKTTFTYEDNRNPGVPTKKIGSPIFHNINLGSSTGLNEMAPNKQVANVRYYNYQTGQEIQQPNGMTIVVTTYTDGSTSTVKAVM